jgi:hypothetical protein
VLPSKISAPVSRTLSGNIAFTVPAVPTGMNAGVRISPRTVLMTPVRAAPSPALMWKEKALTPRHQSNGLALPPLRGKLARRRRD